MPSVFDRTTTASSRHFAIVRSAAAMPSTCKGRYDRIAVVELRDPHAPIVAIRESGNVLRVVALWDKRFSGRTERSASGRAMAAARQRLAAIVEEHKAEASRARGVATRQARRHAPAELAAEGMLDAVALAT